MEAYAGSAATIELTACETLVADSVTVELTTYEAAIVDWVVAETAATVKLEMDEAPEADWEAVKAGAAVELKPNEEPVAEEDAATVELKAYRALVSDWVADELLATRKSSAIDWLVDVAWETVIFAPVGIVVTWWADDEDVDKVEFEEAAARTVVEA